MSQSDNALRAQALEAYEAIRSLDDHGELARLILAEVSLLTEKYRLVRRHDIPHIRELADLLDLFWQEVEMRIAAEAPKEPQTADNPILLARQPEPPAASMEPAEPEAAHKPVFHSVDYER